MDGTRRWRQQGQTPLARSGEGPSSSARAQELPVVTTELTQEFAIPYAPEQNGMNELICSTIEGGVLQKEYFASFEKAAVERSRIG
jgi:hypothetical protein